MTWLHPLNKTRSHLRAGLKMSRTRGRCTTEANPMARWIELINRAAPETIWALPSLLVFQKGLNFSKWTLTQECLPGVFLTSLPLHRFLHVRGRLSVRRRREGPLPAAGHEGERHPLHRLQLSPHQPRRLQPRHPQHPGEGRQHLMGKKL